jgi:hypothetical protein
MPLLQTFGNATARAWESFGPNGGPAAYELISTTILASSAASVTFSGLGTSAAAYKHLQIRITARDNRAAEDNTNSISFNGDTTYTNYRSHYIQGYGGSVTSGTLQQATAFILAGPIKSANSTASTFGATVVDILDWAGTKNKTVRALGGEPNSGVALWSGLWMSTAAITSLTIQPFTGGSSYVTGSRFSLYGLR